MKKKHLADWKPQVFVAESREKLGKFLSLYYGGAEWNTYRVIAPRMSQGEAEQERVASQRF